MVSVVVIGTGNVAHVLFNALHKNRDIEIKQVVGRSYDKLSPFKKEVPVTTAYNDLAKADLYILAVSDAAITAVAQKMSAVKGLVVHTSGATPMSALNPLDRIGVCYPLQTFTQGMALDMESVPICVEAKHLEDEALLLSVASKLSGTVRKVASPERKILHLCAVFVNNFTNYMYTIGTDICQTHGLDPLLLHPLMQETVRKVGFIAPELAQTGPARRGDQETMHAHLDLIQKEEHRQLYILLSNAIKKHYGTKL